MTKYISPEASVVNPLAAEVGVGAMPFAPLCRPIGPSLFHVSALPRGCRYRRRFNVSAALGFYLLLAAFTGIWVVRAVPPRGVVEWLTVPLVAAFWPALFAVSGYSLIKSRVGRGA